MRLLRREAVPGEHARVLARRDQQQIAARRRAAPQPGRERQIGRFGAAAGEDQSPRRRAGERGDRLTRGLDRETRRPPLGMDRGGIARQIERGDQGRARLRPQRRGGIGVEIEAVADQRHGWFGGSMA